MSAIGEEEHSSPNIGTGSASGEKLISRTYHFGKYDITVILTADGRFVGIEEVRINKDFRSFKQRSEEMSRHIDELPSE